MPKYTVEFPLRFSNDRIVLSTDPAAELDLFLAYPPNRRTVDPQYGLDLKLLLQTPIDILRLTSIALLEIKRKFRAYITQTSLTSARIFKEPQSPRILFLEVYYRYNKDDKSKLITLVNG